MNGVGGVWGGGIAARAIQALYDGGMARVKIGQSKSEMFNVRKGVRQGCTLSPWSFNVFVDKVAGRQNNTLQVERSCLLENRKSSCLWMTWYYWQTQGRGLRAI